MNNTMVLLNKVKIWAGLDTANGRLDNMGNSLAKLNDSGQTFKQIAKVIKNNIDTL